MLGRLTEKSFPDGTSVSFEYDSSGRMINASNAHESYTMTYDAGGRPLTVTDSQNRTITYAYDGESGKKTSVTGPFGHTVGYAYNDAGRLGAVTSGVGTFAFTYDDMGRRSSFSYPNGVTASYAYDDDTGRLVNVANVTSTGVVVASNAYTHDAVGNRTVNTDQARGAEYSYDTLYRLTEANYTTTGWSGVESGAKGKGKKGGSDKVANPNAIDNQTERYTYDSVGNRLTSEKSNVYAYNDVNQLTSVNGTSYTYDKNGNLTQKSSSSETVVYTYNYENKLTKVVNSDGTTVTFKYGPFGRRIEKSVLGGETARYFYDAEDIFFETDETGLVGNKYTHGPGIDEPLALQNAKGVYFYHADGLGSIVALTDASQVVVQDYQYGFFGDLKDQKNRIKQPYRYTGREWDKETGLYYYRARYYDAKIGTFTTKDPIGFRGGMNLYLYVGSSPVNYIDPWGLEWVQHGERGGLYGWRYKYSPEERKRLRDDLTIAGQQMTDLLVRAPSDPILFIFQHLEEIKAVKDITIDYYSELCADIEDWLTR